MNMNIGMFCHHPQLMHLVMLISLKLSYILLQAISSAGMLRQLKNFVGLLMLLTLTTAANPVFKLSADYYPPSSSYRNPLNIDPRLRLIGGSCFDGMASLLVEVPAATEYDYFDIYRALFPAGPYERIGNTQGAYYPPTSFLDHSVENDRIYYYKAGLVNENQTLDTSDYTVVIPSKIHHLLPSPLSGFSPVIDGRLDSAEWHDAQQLVITNHMGVNGFMPDSQVYLYLKNDNNFLYMGIEDFNDDLSLWSEIGIYLDYNHDKSWPVDSGGHEGNFYLKYNRGRAKVSFRPLFGQLPNVYSASIDTLVEGIEFAASAPKGHAHWEVKVSLNDGYFIAKEGDTLGIRLYVLEKNSNLNACFPAAAIWIDPRTYGDLIVSSPFNAIPAPAFAPYPHHSSIIYHDSVKLAWSGFDRQGDQLYYDLLWGETSPPNQLLSHLQTDSSFSIAGLVYDRFYYWQINSYDQQYITPGPIWQFRVEQEPNTAPSAAWGPDPSDGATEVSPGSGLSWRSSADIDGDRVYYDLYLGAVELPSVATVRDWGDTLWTPPSALSWSTLYRWRVVSRDGRGGEMASDIWSFTIRDTIRDPVEEDSECFAHPIPFTPNDDGINDRVFFKYPADRNGASVKIFIFDMFNHKIKEIKQADFWDGRDDNGKKMNSNPYYYLLELDGKIVCKGLIYIAR